MKQKGLLSCLKCFALKQKKHFYTLLALLAAVMISFPLLLQLKPQAASTPGKTTLTKITATDYNKIKIQWKKTSGATNYIVYYRKHGTSKWTKLATTKSTASSYTHTSSSKKPIIVGQQYDYTVKAYNSKTKKSGKYNTKGLTAKTVPQTVKLNRATLNNDAVTVSWNAAKGCNYYVVYCRNESNTSWIQMAKVSSSTLSYTDKHPYTNTTNTYTVKSYYSKTKAYGAYDTKGVSVFVPKIPEKVPTEKPIDVDAFVKEVFKLTNQERTKYGKAPLQYSDLIQKGAMVRAKEIAVCFSHIRPDGSESITAYWETGAAYTAGENIATGYDSPKAVVQGWMNSPGHKAAILASYHTYIGVGFYRDASGKYCWVQGFAGGDPSEKGSATFYAEGGTFPNGNSVYTVIKPSGASISWSEVPVPIKPGYKFNCWVTNYGEKLKEAYAGGGKTTYHAEWIKI